MYCAKYCFDLSLVTQAKTTVKSISLRLHSLRLIATDEPTFHRYQKLAQFKVTNQVNDDTFLPRIEKNVYRYLSAAKPAWICLLEQ